jgi:hypothetical protein
VFRSVSIFDDFSSQAADEGQKGGAMLTALQTVNRSLECVWRLSGERLECVWVKRPAAQPELRQEEVLDPDRKVA